MKLFVCGSAASRAEAAGARLVVSCAPLQGLVRTLSTSTTAQQTHGLRLSSKRSAFTLQPRLLPNLPSSLEVKTKTQACINIRTTMFEKQNKMVLLRFCICNVLVDKRNRLPLSDVSFCVCRGCPQRRRHVQRCYWHLVDGSAQRTSL